MNFAKKIIMKGFQYICFAKKVLLYTVLFFFNFVVIEVHFMFFSIWLML